MHVFSLNTAFDVHRIDGPVSPYPIWYINTIKDLIPDLAPNLSLLVSIHANAKLVSTHCQSRICHYQNWKWILLLLGYRVVSRNMLSLFRSEYSGFKARLLSARRGPSAARFHPSLLRGSGQAGIVANRVLKMSGSKKPSRSVPPEPVPMLSSEPPTESRCRIG